MKKDGYLIARDRAVKDFFTSSSAYDRPTWVSTDKATSYRTVDLAESALKKLLKNGAYAARIVHISEAISFEMPDGSDPLEQDQNQQDPQQMGGQMADPSNPQDQGGMEAGGEPLPVDGEEQHDEDDPDEQIDTDIEGQVDSKLDPDATMSDQEAPVDPSVTDASVPGSEDIVGQGDEEDIPHDGIDDETIPPEDENEWGNENTVRESVTPPVPEKDETVSVPGNIMSALRAASADWKKQAEFANSRDDARATFALTVVAAFDELADLLSKGDMKMAQVKMTSWMSPITSNLPTEVVKFVMNGGKKATLKDLFDSKRTEKK